MTELWWFKQLKLILPLHAFRIMQAACDTAFEYVHIRKQFNTRIGEFQLMQVSVLLAPWCCIVLYVEFHCNIALISPENKMTKTEKSNPHSLLPRVRLLTCIAPWMPAELTFTQWVGHVTWDMSIGRTVQGSSSTVQRRRRKCVLKQSSA